MAKRIKHTKVKRIKHTRSPIKHTMEVGEEEEEEKEKKIEKKVVFFFLGRRRKIKKKGIFFIKEGNLVQKVEILTKTVKIIILNKNSKVTNFLASYKVLPTK